MKAFDQIPYFKKVGAIGTALIFGIEGKRITPAGSKMQH